ncbi:conserved hypothetical protein [Ruegeria lacuscaerulensis ITI-1157]|nr:conserved hypothetical protein [Ruegeria lacuscaerulensis ITI-1157]SHJ00989.1 Protein of unknown function [Ruegeria lacuscaerulensis ITI-1157]
MSDLTPLETEIAYERSALARSLDALSDTIAPQRLANEAKTTLEAYGGEIGAHIWSAARKNPAAFALLGAGAALLLAGPGTGAKRTHPETQAVPPQDAFDGFDRRVAAADSRMKQKMTGMIEQNQSASALSAALDRGLDKLPPKARARVIEARKAAIGAQHAVEKRARKVAKASQTFVHDQPLAAGALALGVGMLAGALLPNTRKEDELLGHRRDQLMRHAQNVLNEELDKLHAAASAKLDNAASQASDALRNQ